MSRYRFLLTVLIVLAIVFGDLRQSDAPFAAPARAAESRHSADEQAIQRDFVAFAHLLEKGNAQDVADCWTPEGEYVADDGTTIQGRASIQKAYAKLLSQTPIQKIDVKIDSIRFLGHDCAIVEGQATVHKAKSETASGQYRVLYVREGGKWRIAELRESAVDGDRLQDLDWLVGTWVSKAGGVDVRTTYEWDEGKHFLQMRFSIHEKDRTLRGHQVIGKDPRTGEIRSWLFEEDGGIGQADWSRDGERWVLASSGVESDGSEMTATNIITRVNADTFTWQSIDRTLDGEALPNIPPIKVVRTK